VGQLTTQRGSVLVVFLLALPVLWGVAQGGFKLAKSTQQALSDQRASDCVHLAICAESECLPFLTFDKAATRLAGIESV
jgi:predicted nucleic acid-binding protein